MAIAVAVLVASDRGTDKRWWWFLGLIDSPCIVFFRSKHWQIGTQVFKSADMDLSNSVFRVKVMADFCDVQNIRTDLALARSRHKFFFVVVANSAKRERNCCVRLRLCAVLQSLQTRFESAKRNLGIFWPKKMKRKKERGAGVQK